MVVLTHVGQSVTFLPLFLHKITAYGMMGVPLFFVVSAYSLCHTSMLSKNINQRWWVFYMKRFFRIAPLYYVGIAGYLLFSMLENYVSDGFYFIARPRYNAFNILSNMFFAHGLSPEVNSNIVPGGWSIATEALFYSIFPVLFLFLKSAAACIKVIAISLIVVSPFILVPFLLNHFEIPYDFVYGNILNMLPVFVLGMSYYFISRQSLFIFSKKLSMLLLCLSLISAFLNFNYTFHITLTPLISGFAFIFLLNLFEKHDWLNATFLMKLGKQSYSMYIIHFVFAWQGSKLTNKFLFGQWHPSAILILCFFGTVLITYMISLLSERFIEKPGIALGRKLIIQLSLKTATK